ncbi:MAG: hypothetical protein AB7S41_03840 [Parvibaculaceae bacterium]
MPLRNRVDPFGDILAVGERGTMMGNRGGRIHDPASKRILRRWTSKAWICCLLHYKDQHHEPMGKGYTSLFFLDEVTALAAGHRPCFYCRRRDAKDFLSRLGGDIRAPAFDRIAHSDRLDGKHRKRTFRARIDELPDGAMVALKGRPHAVGSNLLLPWSFSGYGAPVPKGGMGEIEVLTPRVFVAILAAGYRPGWHASAGLPQSGTSS